MHYLARGRHAAFHAMLVAAGCALVGTPAFAQQPLTEHTLTRTPDAALPAASIADVAWIAGHWQGSALGGVSEEIWAPPLGGAMLGMFRLVRGDAPAFYEIIAIMPHDSSLVLRLKHFHADLTGWEERDETVDFPLVRIAPDTAWFDGLTYRRDGPDALTIFLAVRRADEVREISFPLRRVH
jgi:hypothetical protein